MTPKLLNVWNSTNLVLKVLVVQFIFVAVVFLDIPIVRQTFGFLYLTFVPGTVFLRLFKLKNLHRLEMILFSVGFSIAFLMIAGLLINEIGPMVGILNPLSAIPLMIVLNSLILLFCLLSSRANGETTFQIVEFLKSIVSKPLAFLFLCLPILSLIGSIWGNVYENNSILLFMIIAIALLFITGFLSTKLLPPKLYPLAVLVIAIALLFHRSLVSNYAQAGGSDIYLELNVFRITKDNACWNPVLERLAHMPLARLNNMLSITVLPTIFSNLINMDPVWVLKILYPLLFSFVPLALYHLWQTRLGTRIAFMSAFLFMAQQTFYTEMLGLTRQMVVELFFILLLIVIFNKKIKSSKKMMCFTIFGTALIVSHYAMSLVLLFFLFFAWLSLFAMKRRSAKITLTMVVLFLVLMFSWYIYTSNSVTFDSILDFGNYVYGELGQWANPASRGRTVLRGLGMETSPSIWNSISRGFAYFIQFLIVVGFVGLIAGRVKTRLDQEYFTFTSLSMALLAALILVPGLANTLNMTRFYHILLFFLAPLGALGVEFLIKLAFKRKTKLEASILFLAVLIPYFLFQTSFVYEVVGGASWSLPLSKYRMESSRLYGTYGYIDELSAYGARWLSENAEIEYTPIYADVPARSTALTYYGILYEGHVEVLSNATSVAPNGTVYLNRLNVVHGTIVGRYYQWNSSELSFLNNLHMIYSNGACEIYKKP